MDCDPPASHAANIPDKPVQAHDEASSPLRCCCGRSDCAYLLHNSAALEGLERDVATAAVLGQVR